MDDTRLTKAILVSSHVIVYIFYMLSIFLLQLTAIEKVIFKSNSMRAIVMARMYQLRSLNKHLYFKDNLILKHHLLVI